MNRFGDPRLPARFWDKVVVEHDDGCWQWMACTSPGGYGLFLHGRYAGAHRIAYEALIGPIPQGLVIDHLCRNRACVNPAHMEPVTPKENAQRGLGGRLKIRCKRGHPLIGSNLLIKFDGSRSCRACNRIGARRAWRRHHSRIRDDYRRRLGMADGESV